MDIKSITEIARSVNSTIRRTWFDKNEVQLEKLHYFLNQLFNLKVS